MAQAGGGAPAAAAAAAPEERPKSFLETALRFGIIFSIFNIVSQKFSGSGGAGGGGAGHAPGQPQGEPVAVRPAAGNKLLAALGLPPMPEIPRFPEYDQYGKRQPYHLCTLPPKSFLELSVYLADTPELEDLSDGQLLWQQRGMTFDSAATNARRANFSVPVPPVLHANGTLYAHVFLSRAGVPPDPTDQRYNPREVTSIVVPMNRFKKRKRERKLKSLVDSGAAAAASVAAGPGSGTGGGGGGGGGGGSGGDGGAAEEVGVVSYWKPTLTINVIDFHGAMKRNNIPPTFAGTIQFDANGDYFPMVWANEFWIQSSHLVAINSTVTELPLEVSYDSMGLLKWQCLRQFQEMWDRQVTMGLADDAAQDSLREMLGETSPILLAITFAVSILHTIFDFLAFKNDVKFWKQRRSLEGLSVRAIGINCFFQLVILLYLADNDTSWMILMSNGVGVLIEFWKMGKAFTASLDWGPPPGPGAAQQRILPRLKLEARGSYATSRTREYDDIATAHLLYIVMPLIVGYASFSLLHRQHKSWYSWIISSLVGYIYAFGFVMMTPQLFINYKMRSVAHMPWKVMAYKSINTFIDDLFAFVIKMPIMHRLACFRDDIIFFIFLYQRWIYPVDKTRANEYGQVPVAPEDSAATAIAGGSPPAETQRIGAPQAGAGAGAGRNATASKAGRSTGGTVSNGSAKAVNGSANAAAGSPLKTVRAAGGGGGGGSGSGGGGGADSVKGAAGKAAPTEARGKAAKGAPAAAEDASAEGRGKTAKSAPGAGVALAANASSPAGSVGVAAEKKVAVAASGANKERSNGQQQLQLPVD